MVFRPTIWRRMCYADSEYLRMRRGGANDPPTPRVYPSVHRPASSPGDVSFVVRPPQGWGLSLTSMIIRLICAWASVLAYLFFGKTILGQLGSPVLSMLIFAWLLGIIAWSAIGVVHEAEELAHRLGEPYGTLILTLSIVIIEVALIGAVMLGATGAPTLGRDTMFAVLMIVLNGVVGIGLIFGGLRHFSQRYNLKGASAYLVVIIPLTVIALFLPNFTTSTPDGTLTSFQAIAFSIFTVALYGAFLA